MLSKKERVWLERRKNPCVHCSNYGKACGYTLHPEATCAWIDLDVADPDYKDAAEFEARVAALLSARQGPRRTQAVVPQMVQTQDRPSDD